MEPWKKYAQPDGPWMRYTPKAEPTSAADSYSGGVLPFTRNGENVQFDSNAGLLGEIKRAVKLPGEVIKGEINPLSDDGMRRTTEAAMVMTPVAAASRAGIGVLGGRSGVFDSHYKQAPKAVPSRQALKDATDRGYGEARAMGAEYSPIAISRWARETADTLDQDGRIAPNYPKIHKLLDALKNPPGDAASIRLEAMDALYRELGRLGTDPAEGAAAGIVQKSLDEFQASLRPSDVVAGTASPERAARVLQDARGNAAAGFRSDRVTGLEQTSARRTAAANSGRNADNNIRQRLTSLIESKKGSRGLNAEEKAAIDDVIYGRPSKNAARYFGNLLGGGGGLGSAMLSGAAGTGGALALGPYGGALALVPPVLGAGARSLANTMTRRELRNLDEMVRKRSPLYEQTPMPAPEYKPSGRAALAEMLAKSLAPALASQPPLQSVLLNGMPQQVRRGPSGGILKDGVETF